MAYRFAVKELGGGYYLLYDTQSGKEVLVYHRETGEVLTRKEATPYFDVLMYDILGEPELGKMFVMVIINVYTDDENKVVLVVVDVNKERVIKEKTILDVVELEASLMK